MLLVADQCIRVTLFQSVILVGGIQRQGLQGRLNGLFFRCIRNHHAAHPLRCVLAILIQCNGIPSVRNNVLIGALENIFLNPLSEVHPCVDSLGVNSIFHLARIKQILDFLTDQIFRFFLGGIAVTQQRIDFAALYLFKQRVQTFFIDAAAVFLGTVCIQFQEIVQRILRQRFAI